MRRNVPASKAGKTGSSPTGTNNQVPGVDEADLMKTDPNFIYTVSNDQLSIFRAQQGTQPAQRVSSLKLKFAATYILLEGNYLATFATVLSTSDRTSSTYIQVFDISNRSAVKEVMTY